MLFQKQLFFDFAKFSFHIDRTHIIVSDPFVGVICQGYAAEIIDTLDALCIMENRSCAVCTTAFCIQKRPQFFKGRFLLTYSTKAGQQPIVFSFA